jgi:carnitine monooxygenase subunit
MIETFLVQDIIVQRLSPERFAMTVTDPTRLTTEELQSAQALLDAGRSLPAYWYSARHVFDTERRKLFRSTWLYFGQESALPGPGTYATETVATMPIIVTRDRTGELNAFFNTCRHRMHEVATGRGPAKALTCHYHGWRYKLTGELTGVPRSAEIYAGDSEGFDKEQFGLQRVQVASWYGLIFINADPDAPPFEQEMGDLTAFAEHEPMAQDTVVRHTDIRTVDVNWKTLVDNLIECYHCSTVHPELAAIFDVTADKTILTEFTGGGLAMQNPLRGDHTPEEIRRGSQHAYFLPPNAWISCKGDRWSLLVVIDPVSEHRSRLISVFLCPADMPQGELDEIIKGADLVNEQDVAASTSAQRGYDLQPDFDAYQLPESERPLRRFARTVLDAVSR